MGYFKPIMAYYGVKWPIISSYLAVQEFARTATRASTRMGSLGFRMQAAGSAWFTGTVGVPRLSQGSFT